MINYKTNKYIFTKNNLKTHIILVNLYIKCSSKNTIITLTQNNGLLLKQWSTKSLKKLKLKKNTPYNIQLLITQLNQYLDLKKIKKLNIYFNGTGLGRFNILKNIKNKNIKIGYIYDITPIPFNGCRIKKKKRH
jgi:small subunit ribosomal protein S11